MPGRSSIDDPLKVFRFIVEVDGFARAGFTEVTGLQATTEVVEYEEGGDNATPKKSPGRTTFDNITLKRGQFIRSSRGGDEDFINWFQEVFDVNSDGAPMEFRRTIDIVQFHRDRSEARRWRVYEAWPCKFKAMGDLSGTGDEDSIEEIEICHEGFAKA